MSDIGTLVQRSLAYDLDAKVMLDYAPTGLRCTIVVPLNPV